MAAETEDGETDVDLIASETGFPPTEEDFEAARLVMESDPQLFSPMPDTWPEKTKVMVAEARLAGLAKSRARSRKRFDQKYAQRPLRNQMEEAVVSHVSALDHKFAELVVAAPDADPLKLLEQAVRETPTDQIKAIATADAKRPLDIDMVRDAYETLDERLAIYAGILGEFEWLKHSPRAEDERETIEKTVDRLISEMNERVPVAPENLQKVIEFAEEVRQQQKLPEAQVGNESRTTAWALVSECLRYLTDRWASCKATAERSRTDRRYLYHATASYLFCESELPPLPDATALQLRLNQEAARLRIALKSLLPTNSPPPKPKRKTHSPWLDRDGLIELLELNGDKSQSARTLGRIKEKWIAEPRPDTNFAEFRFQLATLRENDVKYPPEWDLEEA